MKLFSRTSDRFGYYTVGTQKCYSKFEAIQLHKKTGSHPEWHYHDEVFSSYDWMQEPVESLTDLYKKRAKQLREKYDYIVLFYSGGADSTNILDIFVDNKIRLDEIATFHQWDGNKSKSRFGDSEIAQVALPKLQQIKNFYPAINLRIINQTQLMHDYFTVSDNVESWIYEQTAAVMPCSVRTRIPELDPFYKDLILRGKNICFLWGVDKPRIFHDNNRFSFRFMDVFDNTVVPGSSVPTEFFYWSADLPELMIKQAHVIKRYLENSNINSQFISSNPSHLANRKIVNQTLWLSNHGVHSLIYPTWDINTFTVGKTPTSIITPTSQWFADLEESNRALMGWKAAVQSWWIGLPEYWRNDTNDMFKGIKVCLSKPYYLN